MSSNSIRTTFAALSKVQDSQYPPLLVNEANEMASAGIIMSTSAPVIEAEAVPAILEINLIT